MADELVWLSYKALGIRRRIRRNLISRFAPCRDQPTDGVSHSNEASRNEAARLSNTASIMRGIFGQHRHNDVKSCL